MLSFMDGFVFAAGMATFGLLFSFISLLFVGAIALFTVDQ